MCFGLQNKSYCILNTQYSPDEYWTLLNRIKTEMLERGEYADGVGIEFSAQAYNFSIAQIAYPLPIETIKKLGGYIGSEPESNAQNIEILKTDTIPATIDEVSSDILSKGLECNITRKPFRITESELNFYRKIKMPLPRVHPSVRTDRLYEIGIVGKKFKTTCKKCNNETFSIFNPKENFLLYCESCYREELN